jgi:pimeloyl-ACP methyl ester carboxylesterase
MKTALRVFATCIGLAVLAVVIFIACARAGLLTPSEASLRARYALPNSKFIEIDGEPIHYVDEGSGDAIVLVHGSLGSLLMWNDWAKALTGHYRVIRYDRPPAGLSGPDPQNRYDLARETVILDGLVDRLGLDRFFLVATSSGGISALDYAASHPGRIEGLVVSNIGVGVLNPNPTRYPWILREMRAIDPVFKNWRSEAEWRLVLENNMVDRAKITDALVRQWTDFNNRAVTYAAARQPRTGSNPFARAQGDLEKITAPALVLWSENDSEIPPHPTADDAMKYLGSADKTLIVVPHCEHMMPLDCGPESVAAAIPFFDRVSAQAP